MAIQERLYTVEEFLEIANLAENADKRLELDEGIIVEMPPSSFRNTVITMRIGRFLGAFVDERNLGYVSGPDGGYQLSERTMRQPDVAYISKQRHSSLEGVVVPVAPDLVVEVISQSEDPMRKANQYFTAGTKVVWIVYAADETIIVCTLLPGRGVNMQSYDVNGTIDGGDVLPGFMLRVSDVFRKEA